MKSLLSHMLSAGLGLWLATIFIQGVSVQLYPDSTFFGINLTIEWQLFILFGIILGLLNYFVKPVLNVITLPLRIITLGLFGFIINMALVWIIDIMFRELNAPFLYPLLWTTLIIWALNLLLSRSILRNENS